MSPLHCLPHHSHGASCQDLAAFPWGVLLGDGLSDQTFLTLEQPGEKAQAFIAQQVMSLCPNLHQQYVQACQNLGQAENPFIAHMLQEADKNDETWSNGITLKIAGNNRLVPVQRITDDDLQALTSVLHNTVFVTGLDLRFNVLTDVGGRHVAKFLEKNSTLRYLNLMLNDIGTKGAVLIAEALRKNKTLLYLRMTGNKIGRQGGLAFATMLPSNSTLERLDLGDCDLDTECLIALATALNLNQSVKAINLNRPLLHSQREETTVHVALTLKINSSLVELHLGKHEMKNFGVQQLCEALYMNSTLRYLDLSCNKITCDGIKFLAKLLEWNETLQILDLNANRIEDDGAIYLSEALASYNNTLQALSVTSNNIRGKGLLALSDAMKRNTELSYIYIWGNKFDEATCMAYSELLQMGRLKPNCTDVEPFEVDGHIRLAELSHGLKKHYYWTPSFGEEMDKDANAGLAIAAVSEHL
ncbi:leucine-rich repeat-containing protein 34 [Caloenas nicobarica]|uniref:leucine-rich repeat-containing protein 34 n=1 Tax=Caloenas nicobarica TaxID=187106 RepID=UPI0032B74827